VSFAIDPALDADELEDVIWMLVEPDGIEPTTSSMPLLRTIISGYYLSALALSKSFQIKHF
jgi:hypothetical protein